ncbi:sugar phosphate nucleotidyltransferase [Clostridium sp. YIM B02555]|uniref:sugar phosphate nucleotidyltransferase n=1 Tax=Clostridium sp. YIM B02555 TaxID=2911968 RepID=UPI001EEF53BA|nr:sugar phosphate nucleotidyltransferase [Clostridium sp. YIM B02555]
MDSALILAGGLGTRLRPLTYAIPKPLLPIGEKPILEIIINNLKKYGISNIYISVNYKKELIKSYFGSGEDFGVNIYYLEEKQRLGTAGPIGLLKDKIKDDFFIINGDLYTDINIEDMFKFHKKNSSVFTIATRTYEMQIPYGVLDENHENKLIEFKEKPKIIKKINSGIYICNNKIINLVKDNESIDMPDLWEKIKMNHEIYLYNFEEEWTDIGMMNDYMKLQEKIEKEKLV